MRRSYIAFVSVLIGLLAYEYAGARIIGVNPKGANSDIWCNGGRIRSGPSGVVVLNTSEDCIDYLGDYIPTTNNAETLGTSSLQWANIYTVNESVTGYQQLAVQTTTQLALRTDPVGATFLAEESMGGSLVTNTYNVCTSTAAAAASYVYIAVSTSMAAKAGSACSN